MHWMNLMNSMKSRLSWLMYALPILPAALVAGSVLRLATADQQVARDRELFRKIRGSGSQEAGKVGMDDYVAIRPGCFYNQHVTPPPPEQLVHESAPQEPKPTGMSAVYVLRGILAHSDPTRSRAFIEIPGVSEQRAYGCGDDAHGSKVVSIAKDTVLLRRGEEDITLTVRFEDALPDGRKRVSGRSRFTKKTPGRSYSGRTNRTGSSRPPNRYSRDSRLEHSRGDTVQEERERQRKALEKQQERERIRRTFEMRREKKASRDLTEKERERQQRAYEKQQEKERLKNMSKEERVEYMRTKKLEKKANSRKKKNKR